MKGLKTRESFPIGCKGWGVVGWWKILSSQDTGPERSKKNMIWNHIRKSQTSLAPRKQDCLLLILMSKSVSVDFVDTEFSLVGILEKKKVTIIKLLAGLDNKSEHTPKVGDSDVD